MSPGTRFPLGHWVLRGVMPREDAGDAPSSHQLAQGCLAPSRASCSRDYRRMKTEYTNSCETPPGVR